MRQVRARLEGRVGAGVAQPWRDLRKLLRKERITPERTGWVFRAAPLVLVATVAGRRRGRAVRHHRARRWTRSRTCSRSSRCCCWARCSSRWPGSTPAPRSVAWAPAAR